MMLAVPAAVYLYAATQLCYVVVQSGLCLCKHHRCTKHNTSALLASICALCFFIRLLSWMIVPQWDDTVTAISLTIGVLALGVSMALLATSIADMVYHGEDMACWRRCINIVFWIFNIIGPLSISWSSFLDVRSVPYFWSNCATYRALSPLDDNVVPILRIVGIIALSAVFVLSTVLIVMAHRKMRKVNLHPIPLIFIMRMPVCWFPRVHHDRRSCAYTRHRQSNPLLSSNWATSLSLLGVTFTCLW